MNRKIKYTAPFLLLVTGIFLATTIVFSRLASMNNAPVLWFLTVSMGCAGAFLLVVSFVRGSFFKLWKRSALFCVGAGLIQALSYCAAYVSAPHVGVGYVSLAFVFPLLITYLLALVFRFENFSGYRMSGVVIALSGGALVASSKFEVLSLQGISIGWLLIASSIPFIIALGNLYRSKFWPEGASPIILASQMLMVASIMVAPIAALTEGPLEYLNFNQGGLLIGLTLLCALAFAVQFLANFSLLYVAGPVYLSLVGSVAAVIATPFSVLYFGEILPPNFALSVALIVAGIALFQFAKVRA